MKKVFLALVFALVPSVAQAGITSKNLSEELKLEHICLDRYASRTASITVGVDGLVFRRLLLAGTSSVTSMMPYPARLRYGFVDFVGADNTLSCTNLVINGWDQFGNKIRHTDPFVTDVSGVNEETALAFAVIDSITIGSCTAGGDAADRFLIWTGPKIGLQRKVAHYSDIESFCISDASDGNDIKCPMSSDGTATDIQSAYDSASQTVDVSQAMFGAGAKVAAAADDGICWTVRPSFH